jgi:hypothetical protein
VPGQHGLGQPGHGVEAEPPGRPGCEEVLCPGQRAEQRLHQHQPADQARPLQGEQEGRRHARVDGGDHGRLLAQGRQQRRRVAGQRPGVVPVLRAGAGAEAAQVGGDDPVAGSEGVHDRRPQLPGVREAVQQQHGRPLPGRGDVQLDSVDGHPAQLSHNDSSIEVTKGDLVTTG